MNRIVSGFVGLGILVLLSGAAAFGQTASTVTITTTSPLPEGYTGVPYSFTFSATTNPPNQTLVWSISSDIGPPAGLTLASNGTLSGTPTASAGQYIFTVTAAFAAAGTASNGASGRFFITIGTPQITVTTPTTLPAGFVGQAYSQTTLQATSVPSQGITWLPSTAVTNLGLQLSTTGILSGTPTSACAPCVLPITAEITGSNVSVTTNFSLTVNQGQVVINTATLPLAPVNQRYSVQLSSTPAGATWSLGGAVASLPPGITLTPAGVLSGIPTTTGAYPLTVTAAVQGYLSAQANLTLYVTNGPLGILQTSIPVAIQNVPYQTALTGTGGLPPYTWSTNNTVGMTIGATSGTINGTATTLGAQSLPVTVTDSTGTSFTESLALFVASPLSVTTTSLPNGTTGSNYSQTLQAGGGQAPYTWALAQGSGTLPTGLTLSTSGTISGVPSANGVSSFTVQVTDFGQRTATKVLTITVASSALTITTASLPSGPIGTAYSQTLAASGGTAPYTWGVVSGSLPAGLSLAKNGTLSGTPTGPAATSTFTVQVTDSTAGAAPLTAQKAFTINVTSSVVTVTTTSLPNGSVGVAYIQTLQASGGTPPYTWSLASGPLPGGLQLNSGTGAISGTPTAAGPFGFVVVATDAGGQTAQKSLAITITAGLTITTGNLTGTVGSPFSQALSASGGSAPYTFALTGTLPAGLTFSASTDLISGTPTAAGTSTVTVTATDSAKNTASAAITITVNQAALPPVTFTVGTGSAQPPITLCLGSTFPSSVTGTLTAAFAPASSVAVGTDQSIQLILAGTTKGTGPTVTFIVPACGQTPPTSAMVTMGTVAGTITISATLNANGVNVTPSNLAPQTITVPAAPPVIQSVSLTQVSGSVTVSVIGYSSTREVISGVFNFAPATGSTLSQSSITVQLGAAYTTWYQSAASNAFGSLFQLTVPFTVSGSGSNIVAATVTLTNTKGTSAAVTSQ